MSRDVPSVLCINSGSSSLKLSLYALGRGEKLLLGGAIDRIGLTGGRLRLRRGTGETLADSSGSFPHHRQAVAALFEALKELDVPQPDAVGHRLVHGGSRYREPALVTPELLEALHELTPLAPLHLPSEILAIEAVAKHMSGLPQVACFDTAFHRRMPELAQRLPLPRGLWHAGVRRYGFHGLSYEYIMGALGPRAAGRVVVAHLGNGASMMAAKDGQPLDTTMGLTPSGGLMMGTRTGDLDPGVVAFLAREQAMSPEQIERLVDHQSGLLGVSEISSDMKALLEQRKTEPHAAEAVALFCYLARKQLGALVAVLGGIDRLVFTGGIGEHAAPVRAEICAGLEYMGIALDAERNARDDAVISSVGSRCSVHVIPTQEDLVIARHTRALVSELTERRESMTVSSNKEKRAPTRRLLDYGQSPWLDFIQRSMIRGGELARLIDEDGLRGVTSNPKIFERAIDESSDYDVEIARLVGEGAAAQTIYESLAVRDIQEAADALRPVYEETEGRDGFVSLEVSPHLARDTEGSIREARRLWAEVSRPNVLIKIPGTREGLSAIRACLAEGVNVNVTLLFGLPRYREVANVYMEAIEQRVERGEPVNRIASVASFFISRIDVMVDPLLEAVTARGGKGAELASELHGQTAVSLAKLAYRAYQKDVDSPRWRKLAQQGASTQRLLWASTGTKNAAYSDVKYIEPLIGPETVNTMPMKTLAAYRDHGDPAVRLTNGLDTAQRLLSYLPDLGISLDQITERLVKEGIDKFVRPYDNLMDGLRQRGAA